MTDKQKYPGPVYAVAGLGDYAAEKLRALPDRVAVLQERARTELHRGRAQSELSGLGNRLGSGLASWRHRARRFGESINDTDMRTDLRRFQGVARRRAGELATVAARNLGTAQDRAGHVYEDFVSRGSLVLDGPRRPLHVVAEVREDEDPEDSTAGTTTESKADGNAGERAAESAAGGNASAETAAGPGAESSGHTESSTGTATKARKATRPANRKPVSKTDPPADADGDR